MDTSCKKMELKAEKLQHSLQDLRVQLDEIKQLWKRRMREEKRNRACRHHAPCRGRRSRHETGSHHCANIVSLLDTPEQKLKTLVLRDDDVIFSPEKEIEEKVDWEGDPIFDEEPPATEPPLSSPELSASLSTLVFQNELGEIFSSRETDLCHKEEVTGKNNGAREWSGDDLVREPPPESLSLPQPLEPPELLLLPPPPEPPELLQPPEPSEPPQPVAPPPPPIAPPPSSESLSPLPELLPPWPSFLCLATSEQIPIGREEETRATKSFFVDLMGQAQILFNTPTQFTNNEGVLLEEKEIYKDRMVVGGLAGKCFKNYFVQIYSNIFEEVETSITRPLTVETNEKEEVIHADLHKVWQLVVNNITLISELFCEGNVFHNGRKIDCTPYYNFDNWVFENPPQLSKKNTEWTTTTSHKYPELVLCRGDWVYLVGLSRSLQATSRKSVVTNPGAALNIGSADSPHYRATNVEVIELDTYFGSTFSGVLTDEQGKVQAIWGSFSTQLKFSCSISEDHQFVRGIPIYAISQVLDKIISGATGPPLLIKVVKRPMPLVRILEVELYPILLALTHEILLARDAFDRPLLNNPVEEIIIYLELIQHQEKEVESKAGNHINPCEHIKSEMSREAIDLLSEWLMGFVHNSIRTTENKLLEFYKKDEENISGIIKFGWHKSVVEHSIQKGDPSRMAMAKTHAKLWDPGGNCSAAYISEPMDFQLWDPSGFHDASYIIWSLCLQQGDPRGFKSSRWKHENFHIAAVEIQFDVRSFKVWDPGGLCWLFNNHLEDKVNFLGGSIDENTISQGQERNILVAIGERK